MQTKTEDKWGEIIEFARWYPSPHNSQPIKIEPISTSQALVYYDLDLGLPAESYGIPFAHVCAGVFLESLHVVAESFGFRIEETLESTPMDFTASERLHLIAKVRLVKDTSIDPMEARKAFDDFSSRQTSRVPYDDSLVDTGIIKEVTAVAARQGYVFKTNHDASTVRSIIRTNQETLFDDLRNDAVYEEIMQWLRFSKKEAREKSDGLSAETMIMPGRLLHFFMRHRGLWSMPVIGAICRYVYIRTMNGVRQLGWLEGPFSNETEYLEAGRCFMKVWLCFTAYGVRLHPFGTVITNPRSHKKFVQTAGITEDETSMAWMLFRFGTSKVPPKAFRRSAGDMIIKTEGR